MRTIPSFSISQVTVSKQLARSNGCKDIPPGGKKMVAGEMLTIKRLRVMAGIRNKDI